MSARVRLPKLPDYKREWELTAREKAVLQMSQGLVFGFADPTARDAAIAEGLAVRTEEPQPGSIYGLTTVRFTLTPAGLALLTAIGLDPATARERARRGRAQHAYACKVMR